jgi:outer membrane protein OmpA-like peptidoglycan-associated protein
MKTFRFSKDLFFALALFVGMFGSSSISRAEGLNAENFTPAKGNTSGSLWEDPQSLSTKSFILGYTLSYAKNPVEFGDGEREKLPILTNLVTNHFSLGYAVRNWLSMGFNLPIALYSDPYAAQGYLGLLETRDRDSFFLGDLSVNAKVNFSQFAGRLFSAAIIGQLVFPTGTRNAFLSDDTVKMSAEIPMSFLLEQIRTEVLFSPGFSYWQAADRVYANPEKAPARKILQKQQSLLLSVGGKYWLWGTPRLPSDGTLFIDGGVRGDFEGNKISLNDAASPVEWSAGAGYFATPALSIHGSFGTGLGHGVGAPLVRTVAGIRYSFATRTALPEDDTSATMLSSSAYSDVELAEIINLAKSEPVPPSLGENESYLRLKVGGEIVDIGKIRFEFNSAKLTGDTKETIKRLFEQLNQVSPTSVRIDGHTDSVGSYRYNLALSKRRAESVKAELVRLGFDANILATEGFSYKYPLASNAQKEGRSINRRIEVAIDGESFRPPTISDEEAQQMREWIAPGGKQPNGN